MVGLPKVVAVDGLVQPHRLATVGEEPEGKTFVVGQAGEGDGKLRQAAGDFEGGGLVGPDADDGRVRTLEGTREGLDGDAVDGCLAGNGLPNQKGKAKFGVVDLASRKAVFEKQFDAEAVALTTREPLSSQVAFVVNHRLCTYDPKNMSIAENSVNGLGTITGSSMLALGDGTLIAASGNQIVRIDIHERTFHILAQAPAGIECMALAADGRLYFSHQADLYRLREPIRVSK